MRVAEEFSKYDMPTYKINTNITIIELKDEVDS